MTIIETRKAAGQSVAIESKTCSRCGGSGSHSFNMMHGSRCYGCSGTGKQYTKRGAAAKVYLEGMRTVPAESIKVGDKIQMMIGMGAAFSYKFCTVTGIEIGLAKTMACYAGDGQYTAIKITTADQTEFKMLGNMVRKGWTGPEKQAQLIIALDYQDTLTKAGQPAKSKTKPITTGE